MNYIMWFPKVSLSQYIYNYHGISQDIRTPTAAAPSRVTWCSWRCREIHGRFLTRNWWFLKNQIGFDRFHGDIFHQNVKIGLPRNLLTEETQPEIIGIEPKMPSRQKMLGKMWKAMCFHIFQGTIYDTFMIQELLAGKGFLVIPNGMAYSRWLP